MPVGPVQLPGRRSRLVTRAMAHSTVSGTIRAATLRRAVHAPCSRRNYCHAGNDVWCPTSYKMLIRCARAYTRSTTTARTSKSGFEDPSDPENAARVLAIMRADRY
jgi:hypothetical protein